jgi:hypothetical protein
MENEIKYMSERFKETFGFPLNLKNPKSFNEKIQWIKIYDRMPLRECMADKIESKNLIIDYLGSDYVPKMYYYGINFNELILKSLPESFVIKASHGSKMNFFVKDKKELDITEVKNVIKEWLQINYYDKGKEWCYKNLKKRILVEELLVENDKFPHDYKFFMMNNKVRLIIVDSNRFENYQRNFYNKHWEPINIAYGEHPTNTENIMKPKNLNKMIEIATLLSKNVSFVRVDMYNLNGKIIVGELTNYPANGFSRFVPMSFDYELGSYLEVKEEKRSVII